jgi:hypothetical protein
MMRPLCWPISVDEFAAMAAEPVEGPGFVLAHEAPMANDICGKNGR